MLQTYPIYFQSHISTLNRSNNVSKTNQPILKVSIMSNTNNVFYTTNERAQIFGAMALRVKEVIEVEELISEEDRSRFYSFDREYGIIIVGKEIANKLSEQELAAVIAHEQAHIDFSHVDAEVNDPSGMVNNMQFELEADAKSASIHGAKVVQKALVATCCAIIGHCLNVGIIPKSDAKKMRHIVITSMRPRLEALKSVK